MQSRLVRNLVPLRAACAAFLFLLPAACGGSGPDTSGVEKKLLDQVNLNTGGQTKFTEFKEKERKSESMGGVESCVISFQGEMEFTGNCNYHMKDRKKGDRLKFDATVEFIKDASGWRQLTAGLYPRG
jgi:hypothetical protein